MFQVIWIKVRVITHYIHKHEKVSNRAHTHFIKFSYTTWQILAKWLIYIHYTQFSGIKYLSCNEPMGLINTFYDNKTSNFLILRFHYIQIFSSLLIFMISHVEKWLWYKIAYPASGQIGGFTETEVLCEAEIEGWRREASPTSGPGLISSRKETMSEMGRIINL